ncbi:MAG: DUF481 domain-containing protein [Verrucomicrobiota bacterium]
MESFKPILMSVLSLAFVCATHAEEGGDPWEKFVPPPDSEFDWVQLPSGEWLKGEVKVMYNYTLEFDSDELDLQKLDFEDIKQLRTCCPLEVMVERERRDMELVKGLVAMDAGKLVVEGKNGRREIPREKVVSLASGSKNERDRWSGSVSVGVTMRGGNTETMDVTTMADAQRRTARTRFVADYIANYSEAQTADATGVKSTDKTADNQRLSGYFDWFLTSRLYWQVLNVEYYSDSFVNIDGQYSASTGMGYDFIRSGRTEWTVMAGVGYQEMRFDVVDAAAGDPKSADSAFGMIGTRLDYDITGDIEFVYDYSARFLSRDNGKYTHHMIATLSVEFWGDFDLDVSAIWDRLEKPADSLDAGGNLYTPEQDDYQLVVGLAYDF